MANPFKGSPVELHGMVYDMVPVTPNDGTDNVGTGNIAVGLYVTNAGDVSFDNKDGVTRTVTVPDNFKMASLVQLLYLTTFILCVLLSALKQRTRLHLVFTHWWCKC
jgi:hypothetical protein